MVVAADFNFLFLPPFSFLHSVRGMGNDAFSFLSSSPPPKASAWNGPHSSVSPLFFSRCAQGIFYPLSVWRLEREIVKTEIKMEIKNIFQKKNHCKFTLLALM